MESDAPITKVFQRIVRVAEIDVLDSMLWAVLNAIEVAENSMDSSPPWLRDFAGEREGNRPFEQAAEISVTTPGRMSVAISMIWSHSAPIGSNIINS